MNQLAQQVAYATMTTMGSPTLVGFVEPNLKGPDGRLVPAIDVLKTEPRMVLFAPPGSGKTSLLRTFAHEAAKAYLSGEAGARAPLFVRGMSFDLGGGFAAELGNLGIAATPEDIGRLLDSGDIILLVDGVDEMRDSHLGAYHIADLLYRHPKLNAVVATRPGAFGAELSELASYSLAPLSHDQVAALVRGLALGDDHAAKRFQDFLTQSYDLADISSNPLLTRILWEASDGGSAPFVSTADLFNDFLDTALRTAARATGADLGTDQLLTLIGNLATQYYTERRHSAPIIDLVHEWSKQDWPIDAARIPNLLEATRLFAMDDGDLTFVHKSLLEFMVARHLYERPLELVEALELGNESVDEILRFAAALSDEVAPLVDVLLTKERILNAITCLRFARVENDALAAFVAVRLGGHIGEDFIRRLVQQIPPDLDHIEGFEIDQSQSGTHDNLLKLLDDACDQTLQNHVRGARFETFSEKLFDGPFEPVHRNFRTEHGELDLIMEIRGGTPFWDHWGPDIFVECKNLVSRVEAHQVHTFASKVETARLKLGFLVSVNGFTEDALAAIQSKARSEHRPLIVPVTGAQIRQLLQRRGPIETFFKDRIRDILYERKFPSA